MKRNFAGWQSLFVQMGALWFHDGNPNRPHALLTSGNHSDGFFNGRVPLDDDKIRNEICYDLLYLLGQWGTSAHMVDRVVGPATGATKMAEEMAEVINAHRTDGKKTLWSSPVKQGEGEERIMVFEENPPQPGERVLLVEDTLTTGGSVLLAASAVGQCGAHLLPHITVVTNRSGDDYVDNGDYRVISLFARNMPIWTPEECPLCQQGSEAIRPKSPPENWALLNAEYPKSEAVA